MPYGDFTLERVEAEFGLVAVPVALFPGLEARAVPDWLAATLERGRRSAALVSEKARSEFIVAPILLHIAEAAEGPLTIDSGQRLAVDAGRHLDGECDFILARTPPVPRLKAPLLTVLEARQGDIELGLGPCAAQMVAARIFNERAGQADRAVFGCVTTGEDWQFLRLVGDSIDLDARRLYLDNAGAILATLDAIVESTAPGAG